MFNYMTKLVHYYWLGCYTPLRRFGPEFALGPDGRQGILMQVLRLKFTGSLLTALLLPGCSSAGVNQPEKLKYIKAVYSEPLTLDPAQMNDGASLVVSNLIYDGLLSFTPNLEIKGAIAETWTTSADGTRLSFHLRADARFHDGTPITAEDAVASLQRAVAPASKVYSYFDCVQGAEAYHSGKARVVAGIRKLGPHDIEIELRRPFPPFLSVLAGAVAKIVPSGFAPGPVSSFVPNGSGPFRWVRREQGERATNLILERFDAYYGPLPKIAQLTLRATDEAGALREAAEGKIHDLANYPLEGTEAVFGAGHLLKAPLYATWMIGLNLRRAPFDRLNVREALVKTIDSEGFRKRFSPDSTPAFGYVPVGLPGARDTTMDVPPTRQAVSREKIRIAIPEELARSAEMKIFLEENLRSKGWNADVVLLKWAALMDAYSKKKLQAFLVSMNIDYPDTDFLLRNFESTNPDNFSGLKSEELDGILLAARESQDRLTRIKFYLSAVEKIQRAAVVAPLFHPRQHIWTHACVRGLEPNLLADSYIDYRVVDLDSKCLSQRGGHSS